MSPIARYREDPNDLEMAISAIDIHQKSPRPATWARTSLHQRRGCSVEAFFYPRTATGQAALIPPPPWHYSGDLLTVEYRTDPARVRELLPAPLELAPDDPGAVAFIWAPQSARPERTVNDDGAGRPVACHVAL